MFSRWFTVPIIWLLLISSSPITHSAQEEKPDLVLYNATIITMDNDDQHFSYLEARNGFITRLEESDVSDYLSDPDVIAINLDGRPLLPGFIDSHSHWFGDAILANLTRSESLDLAISHGWTTINELFGNQERIDTAVQMDTNGFLKPRINMYLPLNYQEQRFGDWYQVYTPDSLASDKVRIAGVKLFMDNGPFIGYDGRSYWFTPEELNPLVKTAHDMGFQIAIHSIVDNATDMALDAIELAMGDNSAGLYRPRLEHALLLRDDQLERLNSMNAIVSAQFLWATSDWVEDIENESGSEEYLSWISRWRDVIDNNITLIGSTDAPYGYSAIDHPETTTSIQALYRSTTRIGEQKIPPPDYLANQVITVKEALNAITIDAAYGTFEEDVKGSITVGKYADLVVLSQNPLTTNSEDLPNIDVQLTIVGGELLYCDQNIPFDCVQGIQSSTVPSNNSNSSERTSNFSVLTSYIILFILPILLKRKTENS